jgi:hypothetical protein
MAVWWEEVIVPEMGIAAEVFRIHFQKLQRLYYERAGSRKWAWGIMMSSEIFWDEERKCSFARAVECGAVRVQLQPIRDKLFVFTFCCLWLELAYPEDLQGAGLSWRLMRCHAELQ